MKSVEKNFANRILFLVKDVKRIFASAEVAKARGAMGAMGFFATDAGRIMTALSASSGVGKGGKRRIHYMYLHVLRLDRSVDFYF